MQSDAGQKGLAWKLDTPRSKRRAQSSVIRTHVEDGHATLEEARAIGAHHDVVVPGREAREQT